ncbi:trehalose-6-phosphate synthase [uncultured Tateyamaria sp.]|uniref:alpha,alpha-trehalose-phosphate synthase (UDP-forming) n=1 Tax=uncultured Tateyamaria sp. TaxID=455651 RepID=UPI00260370B8|nr:trehalose-6-phosphate synthase [uncultured Tateyamaria sp.]
MTKTGRLIVVSNRAPSDGPPSGGLVVALHDCLKAHGGLWVGTSGDLTDTPADTFQTVDGDGYQIKTFDLTPAEQQGYYLSYANGVLWPICHRRADLIEITRSAFAHYIGVNQRLARMLAAICTPEDRIWIHDYHFLPLAACLRAEGVTATLGYFHHIPFPTPQDLQALPQAAEFPGWLAAFDLVGLQTQADVGTALELFRQQDQSEHLSNGNLLYRGREFMLRSFPIGIDTKGFQADATALDGRALAHLPDDMRLIIGVDRLDYSKGLPNRLSAFGRYLDERDPEAPRATFLQIAPPTRGELTAYQDVRQHCELIAGTINGEHAELGWNPINYLHRGIPRAHLAALYRAAAVGLVTPFCDGMNLVAKEYVAAQNPEDPGVLILSRGAGAAEVLTEALIVNPYDVAHMADAIRTALDMPRAERIERHTALFEAVQDSDIRTWTSSYLQVFDQGPAQLSVLQD